MVIGQFSLYCFIRDIVEGNGGQVCYINEFITPWKTRSSLIHSLTASLAKYIMQLI